MEQTVGVWTVDTSVLVGIIGSLLAIVAALVKALWGAMNSRIDRLREDFNDRAGYQNQRLDELLRVLHEHRGKESAKR